MERIEQNGLSILCNAADHPVFLARFRKLELAGAINRIRSLQVEVVDGNAQPGHHGGVR